YVEGLVKAEELGEGGQLDEERHQLVFPDGLRFGIGDRVRVRLQSVNVARRQIDFELLTLPSGQPFFSRGAQGREQRRLRELSMAPPRRGGREEPLEPSRKRRGAGKEAETLEGGRRPRTGVGSREL